MVDCSADKLTAAGRDFACALARRIGAGERPPPPPTPPPGAAKPATPVTTPRPYEPSRPASSAAPSRLPPSKSLDETLLNELSLSLEQTASGSKSPSPKKPDTSLDEQMNKLLGEITKKA